MRPILLFLLVPFLFGAGWGELVRSNDGKFTIRLSGGLEAKAVKGKLSAVAWKGKKISGGSIVRYVGFQKTPKDATALARKRLLKLHGNQGIDQNVSKVRNKKLSNRVRLFYFTQIAKKGPSGQGIISGYFEFSDQIYFVRSVYGKAKVSRTSLSDVLDMVGSIRKAPSRRGKKKKKRLKLKKPSRGGL